jgi:hypothetical protein
MALFLLTIFVLDPIFAHSVLSDWLKAYWKMEKRGCTGQPFSERMDENSSIFKACCYFFKDEGSCR